MKPEIKKLLEDLGRSNYGKALQEYLNQELSILDSISSLPDEDFEINGRANKKAVKIINKLFSFFQEKPQIKTLTKKEWE